MTIGQTAGKMTKHQRWALVMLAGRSARPDYPELMRRLSEWDEGIAADPDSARWVHAKDCGAPAAMERFVQRGLVERKFEYGPRGGEHVYYRPTADGFRVRDYIISHDLKRY